MPFATPRIQAEVNHLVAHFRLRWRGRDFPLLSQWLQPPLQLDEFGENYLSHIEPNLAQEIDSWQDADLKMRLLSAVFLLSELKELPQSGLFHGRPIAADVEGKRISVTATSMAASVLGFSTPRPPYFFFLQVQESKRGRQHPEGPLLAAMLAAQHLNQNGKPLYGAYVIRRGWFFTVLQGRDYARSESLRLTQPAELRQVIATLRQLKQIILNELVN